MDLNNSFPQEPNMNNTVKCPKCGINLIVTPNLLNEDSLICLPCGATFKNPLKTKVNNNNKIWLIVVLAILAIIIISQINNGDGDLSNSVYYVEVESYAATSKDVYDDIGKYAISNDLEAIQHLIDNGQIIKLRVNQELILHSNHFAYSVVSKKGSTQKLWVDTEIMKKK